MTKLGAAIVIGVIALLSFLLKGTHAICFSGTVVIQVKAQDGDSRGDKLNPAGQIEYSIVSTHKHFKIDSETGWLSTNKVRRSLTLVFSSLS